MSILWRMTARSRRRLVHHGRWKGRHLRSVARPSSVDLHFRILAKLEVQWRRSSALAGMSCLRVRTNVRRWPAKPEASARRDRSVREAPRQLRSDGNRSSPAGKEVGACRSMTAPHRATDPIMEPLNPCRDYGPCRHHRPGGVRTMRRVSKPSARARASRRFRSSWLTTGSRCQIHQSDRSGRASMAQR